MTYRGTEPTRPDTAGFSGFVLSVKSPLHSKSPAGAFSTEENDTMIRNPWLNRVHTSAFECSKVLRSTSAQSSLKARNQKWLCYKLLYSYGFHAF